MKASDLAAIMIAAGLFGSPAMLAVHFMTGDYVLSLCTGAAVWFGTVLWEFNRQQKQAADRE